MGTALLKALDGLGHEPDSLPRAFGRYVLFDRIGRGGMADIYLATVHTELDATRLAVVKQILPSLSEDAGFSRMLIEEAKLAARLSHANIVQVFDLGREAGRLYIGMEYVEGYDLNQLLRRLSDSKTPLPAEFAIFIVCEILRALDYAHRARTESGSAMGLVHRDVSPSNVLVSFEGEVKLCDFGIARAYALVASEDEDAAWPEASTFIGKFPTEASTNPPTPVRLPAHGVAGKAAYMAPEHALGAAIDARADVFSAGVILWQLCAGRKLYRGSDEEVLAQACIGKIPPLPDRGMPEHEALQALLDRALSAFVDSRYQTAAAMLAALEDYAARNGLLASQLRFGSFLTDHFAAEIVAVRREREQASEHLISWTGLPDRTADSGFVPDRSGAIRKVPPRDGEEPLDEDDELVSLFSQEDPGYERELVSTLHRSTIRPIAHPPEEDFHLGLADELEPDPFPEIAPLPAPLGKYSSASSEDDGPKGGGGDDRAFPSARSIRESSLPPASREEETDVDDDAPRPEHSMMIPLSQSDRQNRVDIDDPDRVFPSARDIRESLPPAAPKWPTDDDEDDAPLLRTEPPSAPLLVPIAVMLGFALVIAALIAMSVLK